MLEKQRIIAHYDLDTFFVSVERKKDSRLNGKPMMIGGSERGVVASCSYEARKFGVHSGMPMRVARQLCPYAVVISGDYEAYSQASNEVREIVAEKAPLFEQASIDEFYLDLTGMDRFFHSTMWASELRQRIISETGLPISMGLSVNKLVSKVATNLAKPNNLLEVKSELVLPFLAPLAVRAIPAIGPKLSQQLAYLGVPTVNILRKIPQTLLQRAFGKPGHMLYQKARGIDSSLVVPSHQQKSISTERTFREDTMDIQWLKSLLTSMVEKVAHELRQNKQLTGCISVKIRYANFETVSKQAKIPFTASDKQLLSKVLALFDRLYTRRIRLRLIGVRLTKLVAGSPQLSLFEPYPKQLGLYQTMDVLKQKYGQKIVGQGSGLR